VAADGTAKVIGRTLAATALAAVVTLWAAAVTGAATLLAVAIQLLVTGLSLALLRVGMRRAERPADAAHPFGYAGEVAFWSFVVAILLFALGAGVALHEGVAGLVEPRLIVDPAYNFWALAAAFGLALFAGFTARAEFKRRRGPGPAIVALRDLKNPALSSVLIQTSAAAAGFVVAGLGLSLAELTGKAASDGATAILIGLLLAAVAAWMAIEARALIAGEAASPAVIHDVRAAIAAERGAGRPIGAINEIRTLQLGPRDILVAASVDFEDATPASVIEAATSRIEAAVRARHPNVRRLYLEGQSAREYVEAERAAGGSGPAPKSASAPSSIAPFISQAVMTPAAPASGPATAPAKSAAPSAPLPPRESRKGRKRQKGKRR
jgi:cation diffusion facilitator family transporter